VRCHRLSRRLRGGHGRNGMRSEPVNASRREERSSRAGAFLEAAPDRRHADGVKERTWDLFYREPCFVHLIFTRRRGDRVTKLLTSPYPRRPDGVPVEIPG
jgi:hypothetical protein